MKKAIVIGSGFAGMSAACFLAKEGVQVTVVEKHSTPGGRARAFAANGFTFDMGPSWYWMPDVFERFFAQFGKTPADYYRLERLSPSYRVFWEDGRTDIPSDYRELRNLFEQHEIGAAEKLDAFLKEAAYKYDAAFNHFIYQPGLSVTEFMRTDVVRSLLRIDMLTSMHKHVRRYFKHPKLQQLVEFPILFLGALPRNTPALYSMMNYADMKLGTWYPMGGMVQVANAMHQQAIELGVQFHFNETVTGIKAWGNEAGIVSTDRQDLNADNIILACDYHHAETELLPDAYKNYSDGYWDTREMAPSCLLYYVGIDRKIDALQHHNLFFDAPFDAHAAALYTKPEWPDNPLMYLCCPSKTDASVAPEGCENLFILIPVAPGMQDTEAIRNQYFDTAIQRIAQHTGIDIKPHINYMRSYAHNDFVTDYNAFKGNAYGLANTLRQTALLKPSIRNKKLHNLYYAGQLTVPGPGVPPALISGEIVAKQILQKKALKTA